MSNNKLLQSYIYKLTAFLLIIVVIVLGLMIYNKNLKKRLYETTDQTLEEIISQNKFNIDNKISNDLIEIDTIATLIANLSVDRDKMVEIIGALRDKTNFNNLIVVNSQGIGVNDIGDRIDVTGHDCFKGARDNRLVFDEARQILMQDNEIIHIASPIIKNGEVAGVLLATYSKENLKDMILPSFDGDGYGFLVNSKGNVIVHTKNRQDTNASYNIFKIFENATFINDDNLAKVFETMVAGGKGKISYYINDKLIHAVYQPIIAGGWYIFAAVPDDVVFSNVTKIMNNTMLLTFLVAIGVLIVVVYLIYIQNEAIKNRIEQTKQLERLAYFDNMTGMPNFNKFVKETQEILEKYQKRAFVMVKIDIINFKMINEMFGFDIGDRVVQRVATVLSETRNDLELEFLGPCARIHADEFILLDLAEKLKDTEGRILAFEFNVNENMADLIGQHKVKFRYGRYLLEDNTADVKQIIERVNLAHRMAKSLGGKNLYDYNENIGEIYRKQSIIENTMVSAIENREFKLYLQEKRSLKTGELTGAEALVRWKKPNGEIVPPLDFITFFEQNGFIIKLDYYMFEEACKAIKKCIDSDKTPVVISVNFSRLHLNDILFVDKLAQIAKKHNVDSRYLEVELTESVIFENEEALSELIQKLHDNNFSLSMDDFGTGYSSLGMLKNLAVDVVKMDRSFFTDTQNNERGKTVIKSMIDMAKKLNMVTLAEGVETFDQIEYLKSIECDQVQGYFYHRPAPADDFKWN